MLFFLVLLAQGLFVFYDFLFLSFFLWAFLFYELKRKTVLAFQILENGDFFYAFLKDPQQKFLWVKARLHTLYFWHAHAIAFSVRDENQRTLYFFVDSTQCAKDDFRRLKIFTRFFLWETPR